MNYSIPEIESLKLELLKVKQENNLLKKILKDSGIEYEYQLTEKMMNLCHNKIEPKEITDDLTKKFFYYFWGRNDVFSLRHENKNTGKSGYYVQCENFWQDGLCIKKYNKNVKCKDCPNKKYKELKLSHLISHLKGTKDDASDVIGIYPLFPDDTTRLLVFDFDYHNLDNKTIEDEEKENGYKQDVDALRKIGKEYNIPMLVERSRSGNGAHVWIFFEKPILASKVRKFGISLLNVGAQKVNLKSFQSYDRMIPAQDFLGNGELGNLIALPLQGKALKNGNSAFVDDDWNVFSNQWKALFSTKKISEDRVDEIIMLSSDSMNKKANASEISGLLPWDNTRYFQKEDVDGIMDITISSLIYVNTLNLKPRIQNQIRKLARISNPEYYKNIAIGFSNYNSSMYLYEGSDENGYICIPKGLFEALISKCEEADIEYRITDLQSTGKNIQVEFKGDLKEIQQKASNKILKYNNGILSAATAFGKTVVCCNLIAQRKVSTLILLESSSLIAQWEDSINRFLLITEEMPYYYTKTGKIKNRKSLIGIIHGAKDTSTGIVDIAMVGSLFKNGEAHKRLAEYGMILIDECHHTASDTIKKILRETKAKYIYGVTATPFRGDGLEKINEMYLGPIRFQFTAKERAEEQGINHFIIPRFTRTVYPHGSEKLSINEAYKLLIHNNLRDNQISEDIKSCIAKERTLVVLCRFIEHAEIIHSLIKESADYVFLLTGNKSPKEKQDIITKLSEIPLTKSIVLVATGQLIGEGFDFPRLDTLFLADPISGKGVVEQYVGRLNRDFNGKKDVIIYDYIDANIRVFDNMYAKRLKTYKNIGYTLLTNDTPEKQLVNSIYDFESYKSVFEKDLCEANKEIVISSPTLSRNKVLKLCEILKEKQEKGIKVTIVTWHPDSYLYGKAENRIEMLEILRNNGLHIVFNMDSCERFAVIDNETIW